jgi:hypothetical protein
MTTSGIVERLRRRQSNVSALNVSLRLGREGSLNRSLTFQTEPQNVPSRVEVTIMNLPALGTSPSPYAKPAHTFRAAGGNASAGRARLGSESFIDFQIHGSELASFIAELRPQRRPAGVRDGFRHSRSLEPRRADIADNDQSIFTRYPRGCDVQMMLSGVGDLSGDRLCPARLPGALGGAQSHFVALIKLWSGDGKAVAAHRQCLQAKVDANHSDAGIGLRLNLANEREVPAPASVLYEGTDLRLPYYIARKPQPVTLATINNGIAFKANRSAPKRNPSQAFFHRAPTRAAARLRSAFGEYPAHLADGITKNAKVFVRARGQINELKMARPLTPPFLRVALRLGEVIPDIVDGPRVRRETGTTGAIFDPEFVGEEHNGNLAFPADSDNSREKEFRT